MLFKDLTPGENYAAPVGEGRKRVMVRLVRVAQFKTVNAAPTRRAWVKPFDQFGVLNFDETAVEIDADLLEPWDQFEEVRKQKAEMARLVKLRDDEKTRIRQALEGRLKAAGFTVHDESNHKERYTSIRVEVLEPLPKALR